MNSLTIAIIIIFIPGIIAAIVCDKIIFHKRWSSFYFGVYAFTLGAISYLILQIILYLYYEILLHFDASEELYVLTIWNSLAKDGDTIGWSEIFWASVVAIPTSLIICWAYERKILNEIAIRLCISTKYGNENLFSYELKSEKFDWVYVRDFKNNLTYLGRVSSFSETDGLHEIVLSDVEVYRYEDSEELYQVPHIYLSLIPGSVVIEAIPADRLEKVHVG